MRKKYEKGISGSVQPKDGRLYFVAGYNDPITQKRKMKWISLGLPEGTKKSIVNKAQREVQAKFEEEYKRALEGYDDPSAYPLLTFLSDWLEKVHRYKIQESTLSGYRGKVNGKIKRFFGDKVTLADCKPRLIHQFYDSLRAEATASEPYCTITISCTPHLSMRSSRRFLSITRWGESIDRRRRSS